LLGPFCRRWDCSKPVEATLVKGQDGLVQKGDALFVQALSQAADDTDMICDKETF
jgi:hypothetical protein